MLFPIVLISAALSALLVTASPMDTKPARTATPTAILNVRDESEPISWVIGVEQVIGTRNTTVMLATPYIFGQEPRTTNGIYGRQQSSDDSNDDEEKDDEQAFFERDQLLNPLDCRKAGESCGSAFHLRKSCCNGLRCERPEGHKGGFACVEP